MSTLRPERTVVFVCQHGVAKSVRASSGEPTPTPRTSRPSPGGLEAVAEGFRLAYADDHELLAAELPVYDALYAYCRTRRPAAG